MPIRRSPNGVLNSIHRLGRLPGTVGRHPVGTVGCHASERWVVITGVLPGLLKQALSIP